MKRTRLFTAAMALFAGIAMNAETVVFINDNGNDENDGTTPATPVKTLTKALSLIPADADGTMVSTASTLSLRASSQRQLEPEPLPTRRSMTE